MRDWEKNQLKLGVLLSYICMILGYIISFLYTPIMLHYIGQSEYGLYNLVASLVAYLGLLNFGLGNAYIRYYSRYKVNNRQEAIANLNGMFLTMYVFICLITIIAGAILVQNRGLVLGNKLSSHELATAKTLMIIFVFNTAKSFPFGVFNLFILANEKYIFQKVLQMTIAVLNPLMMLLVFILGYKLIAMAVVTTIFTFTVDVSNAVYCFKKGNMKFLFGKFDFKLMVEIFFFSSYIFLNMMIDQVNSNIDKFILARFRGTIAVAIYSLGVNINTYYISLSTALINILIPKVNRMVAITNDNKELTELFARVGRIQFLMLSLVCTGFLFFGRSFLNLWVGAEYKQAYQIVLLLIIPLTIPLIQNLGVEIQKAKNMHQFRSGIYFILCILKICVSIVLIKKYGGIGGTVSTAIMVILGDGIIMNWYYHKKVGLNMKYFWMQIMKLLPALLSVMLIGGLMNLWIDLYQVVPMLLSGILYVILFWIIMWFFGMNRYEKNLLSQAMKKVFRMQANQGG